jgi:hypothetical protein
VILSREIRTTIGGWDARAQTLGGWTFDVHHAYDPVGQILHRGGGTTRSDRTLPRQVVSVAGGTQFGGPINTGDGGSATQARFSGIEDIVVGEDGSVYILTTGIGSQGRIRRVGPEGLIDTIAGGTSNCSGTGGEGGPADEACFVYPNDLARGPDGSLYIGYGYDPLGFVQSITPDGILHRFAGDLDLGNLVQEGPRTQVRLEHPYGIAVTPEGAVYIGEDFGVGTILDADGNPIGGFVGFSSKGLGGLGVGSISASTTSAIIQASGTGGVQIGTAGRTSMFSSR